MEHELLVAAVAVWCFIVAVIGGLLGLVLGNIRLPVLLLLASSPAAGAGANIAVSGVTALTGAIGHVRAGRIDWHLVRVMAIPSIVGVIVGSVLSGALAGDVLLAGIGVLLLYFGIDLLRPKRPRSEADRGSRTRALVLSALGVGFLGGIVGLILGALRMPALLRLYPEQGKRLIGTNLAVGTLVGAAGAVAHVPSAFDVSLFVIGALASVPGALVGARLTGRVDEAALVRGIGLALLVGGSATLVRAALG